MRIILNKYFLSVLLAFLVISAGGQNVKTGNPVTNFTENQQANVSIHLTRYDTDHFNSVVNRVSSSDQAGEFTVQFDQSTWKIRKELTPVKDEAGACDFVYTFQCIAGQSPATAVSVDFTFDRWSVDNYVLMPAAVYGGNRVKSFRVSYIPFLQDFNDMGPDKPQVISDVPRLNDKPGPSRIQQRTGDMSTPSIGFQDPKTGQGFWLLTEQSSGYGDNGIDIEENNNRSKAVITLTAPVVRERTRYFIVDNQVPSTDQPVNFKAGDSVQLKGRVYYFDSPKIQGLYNKFAQIRNAVIPKVNAPASVPFSAAFKIQEEKFNRQNFESNFGYYSVGLRENYYQDWQIGWTGGMISTYPLLIAGNEQSKANVIRNFDWLFPNGISPSGYFWDSGEKGNLWGGIFPMYPQSKDLHLVRKSGDALYYILRQFEVFKQLNLPVKKSWEDGTQTVANAMVKTWKKYGQLGQYVNNISGELAVGGSTSGAISPAAFMLAARYFKNPEYKLVAEQLADYYYQNYITKGLTYGGPGDAMQNFDSESAYGMLESFTVLYEETGNKKWLTMAEELANQYTTWVSSYDYKFPETSTLGKLGKKTTGAVWANTQNKHGAPGICTHSGAAFLRLYRATGNLFYLDLLRDITRAIPQYLSTKENPIPGLQDGWISERVSTTDWLEGIGEIMFGSTWAETSLLLTEIEIPGIYIDMNKNQAFAFDQIDVLSLKNKNGKVEIGLSNPTQYDAKVKVLLETKEQAGKPLSQNSYLKWKEVFVPAGKSIIAKLENK
ncbi:hypothetical protein JZU61_06885 [bacterium]|nr:hypothetical protein [bacterium]